MTNITISKAEEKDVSDIGILHYQAWYDTYKNIMCKDFLDYNTQEKLEYDAKVKVNTTYIAKANNEFCGFLYYKHLFNQIEIHELYILKEYRGLGIGTKLISHLIENQNKATDIILWVLRRNTKAISYYKGQGFLETDKIKIVKVNNSTSYYVDCYKKSL